MVAAAPDALVTFSTTEASHVGISTTEAALVTFSTTEDAHAGC
jgi:hypothetical protein